MFDARSLIEPRGLRGVCAVALLALGSVGAFMGTAGAVAEEDFGYCLVCHGSEVGGNEAIGAPNLTILEPWYVEAQLRAFKNGYRGWHPEDEYGRSMRSAARELTTDEAIEAAADFVAGYSAVASAPTLQGEAARSEALGEGLKVDVEGNFESGSAPALWGDAGRGRELYQSCAACHGAEGAGLELLAAPALAGQNDWYLAKALNDYRTGRRGADPEDKVGASMRLASQQLADDQAVYDVVAYVGTLTTEAETTVADAAMLAAGASASGDRSLTHASDSQQPEESTTMNNKLSTGLRKVLPTLALAAASTSVLAHDVTRHPLPGGSTFPIAQAVTVPAGAELTFHSGLLPRPADPDADPGSREYLGDTYTQTMSVLQQFEASLEAKGMGLGNIIKMNVFLVGDPELDGKMDFAGFMRAYSQFFGTEEQPNLPARAAVQIVGLARGAFIEIEVIAAR